jgi:hypothetical protein
VAGGGGGLVGRGRGGRKSSNGSFTRTSPFWLAKSARADNPAPTWGGLSAPDIPFFSEISGLLTLSFPDFKELVCN